MRFAKANREGFALAVALFAMVIIGGIIAGAFFASNQDYRSSRNTLLQERALAAAEFGLNQVINNWDGNWNTQFATGSTGGGTTYLLTGQTSGPSDRSTITVTRLNDLTFWVVSEGQAGSGTGTSARRRVGQVLRLYIPMMNFLAALTVRGTTNIGGSSMISGVDQNPSGWSCGSTEPPLPGVSTNNLGTLTTSGSCSGASCIYGDPRVEQDPAAGQDATYFDYGGVTWDDLVRAATKTLTSSSLTGIGPTYNADGSCARTQQLNWGDPSRNLISPGRCEGFYPIIYAPGSLQISGGRGQGVLLVEGDLDVRGGFEFFGPVIVKGRLRTEGTGGHFNGGVMAANVELDQNVVLGNAVIQYSSCAIEAAQMGSTLPTRARDRAWAEMF